MATSMSARRTIFDVDLRLTNKGMFHEQVLACHSSADEVTARKLERYFKSGSGKAFAKKRFLQNNK